MAKRVNMKRVVEFKVDEVVQAEIDALQKKVRRLENKIDKLTVRSEEIKKLEKLTRENRNKVLGAAENLSTLLRQIEWADIDNWLD